MFLQKLREAELEMEEEEEEAGERSLNLEGRVSHEHETAAMSLCEGLASSD